MMKWVWDMSIYKGGLLEKVYGLIQYKEKYNSAGNKSIIKSIKKLKWIKIHQTDFEIMNYKLLRSYDEYN